LGRRHQQGSEGGGWPAVQQIQTGGILEDAERYIRREANYAKLPNVFRDLNKTRLGRFIEFYFA
jgi:hypothetical protein